MGCAVCGHDESHHVWQVSVGSVCLRCSPYSREVNAYHAYRRGG